MSTYTFFFLPSNRLQFKPGVPEVLVRRITGVQNQLDKLLQNYELKIPQHCQELLKNQYAYFPYFTNDFGEIGYM